MTIGSSMWALALIGKLRQRLTVRDVPGGMGIPRTEVDFSSW
ncbi:hypothetical protein [Mycobacterium lepromatosis]|nr:hypothetical protein [Mycobacterium lepromatosis]